MIMCDLVLFSLLLFFVVHAVPKLCAGLLNGTPSMSGGMLQDTAKGAARAASGGATTAAKAVGMIAGSREQAALSGGKMSAFGAIGKTALQAVNPFRIGYKGGKDLATEVGGYEPQKASAEATKQTGSNLGADKGQGKQDMQAQTAQASKNQGAPMQAQNHGAQANDDNATANKFSNLVRFGHT